MISSWPERLPNSPKPRLFKAKSASNLRPHIDPMIHVLEKNYFTQGCAGLIVHALLTVYTLPTFQPSSIHHSSLLNHWYNPPHLLSIRFYSEHVYNPPKPPHLSIRSSNSPTILYSSLYDAPPLHSTVHSSLPICHSSIPPTIHRTTLYALPSCH